MGYIRHHAIIVVGTYDDWAKKAHSKAKKIFGNDCPFLSPLTAKCTNGTQSFAVFPDGSKEGWQESNDADFGRDELISWMRNQAYADGSSPLAWTEVVLGSDDCESHIERNAWERTKMVGDSTWSKG